MRATIPGRLERELAALLTEIDGCVRLAGDRDRCRALAPSVSDWSVGEQLEHLLLADLRIVSRLEEAAAGAAPAGRGGPSAAGLWVLLIGAIPRGRGTAPDGTRPEGRAPEALEAAWRALRERALTLRERTAALRASRGRWPHPLLGSFGTWHWIRFAHVHHRHHRNIIEEILARAGE